MRKIWMILCLAVMAMFLISCQPGQAVRPSTTQYPYQDAAMQQRMPQSAQAPYATAGQYRQPYPAQTIGMPATAAPTQNCMSRYVAKKDGTLVRMTICAATPIPGSQLPPGGNIVTWDQWMGSLNEWIRSGNAEDFM